jgi:hypothetical protein
MAATGKNWMNDGDSFPPRYMMLETFDLTGFVFNNDFGALAESFQLPLLYAQGFFATLFLFNRVNAVSDMTAHLTRSVAGFGKGYLRVAS